MKTVKKVLCFLLNSLKSNKNATWKEEFISLIKFVAVLVVVITFTFKPFHVPTGSMIPNLLIGDFLVVNKFAYGYTRYSFPYGAPLFEGRILKNDPKQGDIVVFNNPKDKTPGLMANITGEANGKDYVKRLVGMPGDKIQMIQGILHINDQPVKLERIEDFELDDSNEGMSGHKVPQYKETLPNGVVHTIIKIDPFGYGHFDNTEPVIVPADHMFCMGDNRDRSGDSRGDLGVVPMNQLIGKVALVFFSTSAKWYEPWKWLTGARYHRLVHWAE